MGCKPAYGTLGRETSRGHWSAGAGGLVALRQTGDGGRTMGGTRHWRGAAEYASMDGEEAKYERREETGKMFCRARHPDEYWRGGERKEPKSSLTGNIES